MEFYKEGLVLTVATGITLDLGPAQYKHKAALIVSEAAAPNDIISIKFYTDGVKSRGISFSPPPYIDGSIATSIFTNALIPVRLSEISTVGASDKITVTLFN